MARGASSVAGSATLELERDLRVDTIVSDPIIVDGRFHLLDVDSLDAAHRLGGLLDRLLRGVLPALFGLSQYFNDLQYRHANSSIAYKGYQSNRPGNPCDVHRPQPAKRCSPCAAWRSPIATSRACRYQGRYASVPCFPAAAHWPPRRSRAICRYAPTRASEWDLYGMYKLCGDWKTILIDFSPE